MLGVVRTGLAALALLSAPAALAQTISLPDTPQGRAAKAWLDAVNSPDPADILRVDPRSAGIRQLSGGFDVIAVLPGSPDQIVADLRDHVFGDYQRTTWVFAPGSTKIRGIRAQPTPDPPTVARLDDKALAAFLDQAVEKIGYSGTVLIARDGKPIYTAAAGLADRETKIPVRLDTRFRVGSMNKMMTATAIMQMVQAGKVKLDAPIGVYLKDYPNKDFASTVTIHHLLTHTGGAGDIFGPRYNQHRLELKTLKDYVALYGSRPPEFTPGDDWRYANYGFILLGRVIEEVSGQSYPDYIRDRIFKSAGMTRSGFEPENVAVEGRSKGYMNGPKGLESNVDTLPWSGTSAGGGYSTVADWFAFAKALTGHKLLDKTHTDLLMSRKTSTGYAYGFTDASSSEIHAAGHDGGAPGMNGDLRILGDGQVVIVALTNIAPPGDASIIAAAIAKRVKVLKPDGSIASMVWTDGAAPQPAEAQRMAAFKAADMDNDGKLDKAAYRKVLRQLGFADQLVTLFAQRDMNKDSFISAEEYRSPLSR